MWDLPRPGIEAVSPALAGRFLTTAPPGRPWMYYYRPHFTGEETETQRGEVTHLNTTQLLSSWKRIAIQMRLTWKQVLFSKCFKVTLQTNYIYIFKSLKPKKINHFYSICYPHTVVYILRPDGKITNSPFQHSHKFWSHCSTLKEDLNTLDVVPKEQIPHFKLMCIMCLPCTWLFLRFAPFAP